MSHLEILQNLALGESIKEKSIITHWDNPSSLMGIKGALFPPSVVIKILEGSRNAVPSQISLDSPDKGCPLEACQQQSYHSLKSQSEAHQSGQDTSSHTPQPRTISGDGSRRYPHILHRSIFQGIRADSPWPQLRVDSPQTSASMRSLLASRGIDTFDGLEGVKDERQRCGTGCRGRGQESRRG